MFSNSITQTQLQHPQVSPILPLPFETALLTTDQMKTDLCPSLDLTKQTWYVLSVWDEKPINIKPAMKVLSKTHLSLHLPNETHLNSNCAPRTIGTFASNSSSSIVPKPIPFSISAQDVVPQTMEHQHALESQRHEPLYPFRIQVWINLFKINKKLSSYDALLNSFNSGFHIGIPFI